jgi:hypothetical protein
MALAVTLVGCTLMAAADPIAVDESVGSRTASSEPFLLAPPKEAGPVVVRARFGLHDITDKYLRISIRCNSGKNCSASPQPAKKALGADHL